MARAGLKWTAKELAQKAGVGISTVQRMEAEDGIPTASARNVEAVQAALENAGISFSSASDAISVTVSKIS